MPEPMWEPYSSQTGSDFYAPEPERGKWVEVFMHRDAEGVLLVTIDTTGHPELGKIRVVVNDGDLYSGEELKGLHLLGDSLLESANRVIDVS